MHISHVRSIQGGDKTAGESAEHRNLDGSSTFSMTETETESLSSLTIIVALWQMPYKC